jgi:hypothetical protein
MGEKLLLRGWTQPTLHLLFLEMERAIAQRAAPGAAERRVSGRRQSGRHAALGAPVGCLRAYNEFELWVGSFMIRCVF